MCTALTIVKNSLYFGRNMDIEDNFGQKVVITPRNYKLSTKRAGDIITRFAMIGMANVCDNFPLYAECANEKGLCMAGLYFPSNGKYVSEEDITKKAIAPYELIPYILANCQSVAEAVKLLGTIEIASIPFSENYPIVPLHFIISDANGSVTVESTAKGLEIFDNPYGVLTNNPPFDFHIENVKRYASLSASNPDAVVIGGQEITPYSEGFGALGLPGDFSSSSRFIKALFCKNNSVCEKDEKSSVMQVFHILDSVAMVRGSVITKNDKYDTTIYSCCINATKGIYYFKSYDDCAITKIAMNDDRKNSKDLTVCDISGTGFIER